MSSRSSHPAILLYFQKMLVNAHPENGWDLEKCPRQAIRPVTLQDLPRTAASMWLDGIASARAAKRRSRPR